MQNVDSENLKKIPTNKNQDDPQEFEEQQPITGDRFWNTIKWLHDRGFHKGDYREYESPHYNLNKGEHYYVIEDAKKGSIKCISCPVKHGGILEAHLLTKYTLKDGILSLNGKPINQTPKNFNPDN